MINFNSQVVDSIIEKGFELVTILTEESENPEDPRGYVAYYLRHKQFQHVMCYVLDALTGEHKVRVLLGFGFDLDFIPVFNMLTLSHFNNRVFCSDLFKADLESKILQCSDLTGYEEIELDSIRKELIFKARIRAQYNRRESNCAKLIKAELNRFDKITLVDLMSLLYKVVLISYEKKTYGLPLWDQRKVKNVYLGVLGMTSSD